MDLRLHLASEESPTVLKEVITAVGVLGDTSDIRRLDPFLQDPSGMVRSAAITAIHRLDPRTGHKIALRALGDGDWLVRLTSCQILLRYADKDEQALFLLRHIQETDPSDQVRSYLSHKLEAGS